MLACKSYYTLFIINLALIDLTNAKVLFLGGCPADKKAIEDFEVRKYMGIWYDYEVYPFNLNGFNFGGKCIDLFHGETSNSSVFTTVNSQVGYFGNSKSKRSNITGSGELIKGPNIGIFSGIFDSDKGTSLSGTYLILGTDYKSYAVVYTCNDYKLLHAIGVWFLTRDRIPSNETLSKANEVIHANNISRTWFIKIDQSNCPPDENEDQSSSR